MTSQPYHTYAVEFLRQAGKEINEDTLVLIVLYIKSEPFPVGFIVGKGEKVEYFPASSVRTLEEELSKKFGKCNSLYVLLTSKVGVSEWNRMGVKLCKGAPVVRVWEVQYT